MGGVFAFIALIAAGVRADEYVIPPVTAIPGSGAVTAAEWESLGIYVTDGLVAFYDGIQNDGDGRAHNPAATKWTDRVSGATASFVREVTTRGPGAWADNGYVFNGDYAYMDAACAINSKTFTSEIAMDVDPLTQVSGYPNMLATPDDFGIFINNSNANATEAVKRSVLFKADPYDGNNNSRPTVTGWQGKYLTIMFTDTKKLASQGVETDDRVMINRTSASTTVGAKRWTWGGSEKRDQNTRYTLGKFYGVRLYNRALGTDEQKRNREVDEMRYRGCPTVTNVVVAATLYGEGAEPAGIYTVRGSHTFTAPDCVAGGTTFTATGYTLQKLKTDGTWSAAEEFAGNSYTYTVGAAQPAVRLTWKWETSGTGGALPVDSRLYAQDGLVFHFDGIDNAGFGRHDAAAAVWKNLAVEGLDARFHRFDNDAASCWVDNGYWFSGKSYARVVRDVNLGVQFTVQMVCNVETTENTSSYPHLFGTTSDGANAYTYNTANQLNFKFNNLAPNGNGNNNVKLSSWDGRSATYMYDGTTKYLSQTDARGTSLEHKGQTNIDLGVRPWFIGTGGAGDSQYRERLLTGVIHAVRVYNRVLTDAELAANFEIDSARFRGGVLGDVTVASSHRDAAGAEPCGQYLLADGGHTFSAPAGMTAGGRTYALRGYRVETWDGNGWTGASETAVADGAGASVTLAKGAAKRRLTWLWRVTRGLRAVGELSVDDYVQDGLAAQYDGIANRGRQLPHGTKITRWLEVSGHSNRLDFKVKDGSSLVVKDGWSDTAYNFQPEVSARMRSGTALGDSLTIEQTLSVATSAQTSDYPNFFCANGDCGVYTYKTGTELKWKPVSGSFANESLRPTLAGWGGKYITMLMTPTTGYLFQGTTYANGASRGSGVSAYPNCQWAVGGAATDYQPGLDMRYVTGAIHSTRFYNRALTEEELARNRSVDEVRFRGKTNVPGSVEVAADPKFGLCGADAPGVYLVEGGWTFAAAERDVEIDNKTVTARPTGYWLETLNGDTWGDKQFHSGTEYAHTATASAAPVRLTWKYTHARGTVLTVR